MSPQRQPAPPPDLPGHSYVRLLGSGGFADVYLYERELPKMPVAVKVLMGGNLTRQDEQRFTAEANTMARFSAHPYIVGILAADISSDGRPYIVMQYYPKDNMSVRCRRKVLTVSDALQIGIQVSSAVETAHRAGILHRDIKPANVLTGEFGEPGLTDFGIAAATGPNGAADEGEGLSIPWSPPEAFDSDAVLDERSDVYSLGATVYNLLAGRSPFEVVGRRNTAIDLMERIERWPMPPLERGDIPRSLSRVLSQAMAKQPALRHPSAISFARDLQAVEQELHLKMTAVVVPDESVDFGAGEGDRGADETRGRVPIRIDAQASVDVEEGTRRPTRGEGRFAAPVPDGVGAAGPLITGVHALDGAVDPPQANHGVGASAIRQRSAIVDDATGTRKRPTAVRTEEKPAWADEPERASRRRLGAAVGLGIVAVVVVVASLVMSSSPPKPARGTASTATTGPGAIVGTPVPVPTGVAAHVSGGNATLTWVNPVPESGDFFVVTILSGTQASSVHQVEQTTFTATGWPPGTQFCAQVALARQNGQTSIPSAPACTP